MPALLFGVEWALDDRSEKNKLCHAYNRACSKIYSSYDNNIIKFCRYISGYIPFEYIIDERKSPFARSILDCKHVQLSRLFCCFNTNMTLFEKKVFVIMIIRIQLKPKLDNTLKIHFLLSV